MKKKVLSLFVLMLVVFTLFTTCFATTQNYMPEELKLIVTGLKILLGVISVYITGNLVMGIYGIVKGKREKQKEKYIAGFSILLFTILIVAFLIFVVFRMNVTIQKSLKLLLIPAILEILMLILAYRYSKINNIKIIKVISTIMLFPIVLAIFGVVMALVINWGGEEALFITLISAYIIISVINLIKGKKKNDKILFNVGKISFIGIIAFAILFTIAMIIEEEGIFAISIIAIVLSIIGSIVYCIKNKYKVKLVITTIVVLVLFSFPILISMLQGFQYGGIVENAAVGSMQPNFTAGPFQSYDSAMSGISNPIKNTIGFSTGGAKDINNFRENIENNYLPLLSDITYEGLYYDYYFDTGKVNQKDEMFYPSYSFAKSDDPISGQEEYYLSVGLNSNIKQEDFARKKLNLVIALDISGSMDSRFNSYYYDAVQKYYNDIYDEYNYDDLGDVIKAYNLEIEPPEGLEEENVEDMNKTKMQIANESVNLLIDQLNDDDRFGLVLFESDARVEKELNLIEDVNVKKLKSDILAIKAMGGTNFEAGYVEATKLIDEYLDVNQDEYENRIIVITDAMPNIGRTYKSELLEYIKKNADNKIGTTFIGVGVDFNTELIEELSKVRGANYYSVHDSKSFKDRMSKEFEYMVTPLVYDLSMKLESENYSIEKVYGTNEADRATGEIMYVNTLFPSASNENSEVKGGIILIRLKKNSNSSSDMKLTVTYEDRSGKKYSSEESVVIPNELGNKEYYDNTGIRKGIVLTRYVNLLKNWLLFEKTENKKYVLEDDAGIVDFNYTDIEIKDILGDWERTSEKLTVRKEYKEHFKTFKKYFENEIKQIKDDALKQEIEVLEKLIKY